MIVRVTLFLSIANLGRVYSCSVSNCGRIFAMSIENRFPTMTELLQWKWTHSPESQINKTWASVASVIIRWGRRHEACHSLHSLIMSHHLSPISPDETIQKWLYIGSLLVNIPVFVQWLPISMSRLLTDPGSSWPLFRASSDPSCFDWLACRSEVSWIPTLPS